MRVPRPDLSLKTGTPNPCNQCHKDKPAQWAADAVTKWYGDARSKSPHFGEAIHAGREGAPEAGKRLMDLAVDTGQPGIARATALDLLRRYPGPTYLMALPKLLKDEDPLVRGAAVRYLETTDPGTLFKLGVTMLDDPVRAVRLEAARTMAPLMRYDLPEADRARLDDALEAYRESQLVNAERPESHLNIGLVEMEQGKAAMAQKAYQTALRLDPGFAPAYVNLADLYRALGSDAEGGETLRAGIAAAPDNADLHHALGLLYVREKKLQDALAELRRASELAPESARYAYVHGLIRKETGDVAGALRVLADAYKRHPADRELLLALATINRDAGNLSDARIYAEALIRRYPGDPDAAALKRELSPAP